MRALLRCCSLLRCRRHSLLCCRLRRCLRCRLRSLLALHRRRRRLTLRNSLLSLLYFLQPPLLRNSTALRKRLLVAGLALRSFLRMLLALHRRRRCLTLRNSLLSLPRFVRRFDRVEDAEGL